MSQAKVSDYSLLLEVFRDGLHNAIISKKEVVEWADKIITEEKEPDYFFIEVSLSIDVNDLVSILNKYVPVQLNVIAIRVIYGIVYAKLIDEAINLDHVIRLIDKYEYHKLLDGFESNNIYSLDYYFYGSPTDIPKMVDDAIAVLSYYKDFNLENYDQWGTINSEVEEVLKEAQIKADIANEAIAKTWRKREAKRKLIRKIPISILSLIAFAIIIVDLAILENGTTHPMRIWYLNIFGVYFIARWGYAFWRKRKR